MPSSSITDYLPPGRPSAPRRRPDAAPSSSSAPPRPKPRPTAGSSSLSKSQTSAQAPTPAPASSPTPSARQRRPQQAVTGSRISASASLPDRVLGSCQNPISLLSPVMASTAFRASAASPSRLALSQSSHAARGDANDRNVDLQDDERARATTDSPDPPSPSEIIAAYRARSSILTTSQQPAAGAATDSQQATSTFLTASQQQGSSSLPAAFSQQRRRLGVSDTSPHQPSSTSATVSQPQSRPRAPAISPQPGTNGNSRITRAPTRPPRQSARTSGMEITRTPWPPSDSNLLCTLVQRHGRFWTQMEPIFNASSIHLRSRSSLRDQWDRLTHLADRTPQINAAMQAAATFDRPPPPCSPPRRRVGWTQAELEVLHEGVAQGKGPTAIHRDLVARFTASERTLSSVRRRLDKVPKAAGRSNDEEAEEDDDSEENDDRDSGLPAEASNPSRQPQSSGQVTASPSFSVTTMQRAAAAAHSLGYGHTISRPRREGERTSGASPTSSHKRKRGGQQHGSSWTAREDRVLRACMARGSSGWASFEEVRKGYFKSFPSATRTDSALKVRRSALHRARGRHVSHVSGREEGEEESDEDNPSDEGRHEGVNARQADGEGEDQSQSQSNGVDAAEYSARRTEEIEAEWGGEDDDFGGEAIMDGLPAGDDEVMQTGSGRQLSLSRRLQRPVEAAHDEEGYASHFDRSQTMEPNTQSSNTRTLGEDQQVALQLSAAPPDVQRVSVPLPPSLQTQQAAASSAAAVTPSSETGIPQLLFEPSGVRAKACVAGMEVMIFAHGSAWMSMRGAAMDTTPPFSALPPFHFKILAHGQVQQVRMPPNIMVSVVPRVRDSQAAAEGATSGMSLEWRFVGPEGLTVVLEC